MEKKEIKKEAEEIATELCSVFENYLERLIERKGMETIVNDIVEKTIVCKANREKLQKMTETEAKVNICSIYADGSILISFVNIEDKTKFHLGIGELLQD